MQEIGNEAKNYSYNYNKFPKLTFNFFNYNYTRQYSI